MILCTILSPVLQNEETCFVFKKKKKKKKFHIGLPYMHGPLGGLAKMLSTAVLRDWVLAF